MSAEMFIAKRYMFAKKKLNFITIISYLSFGGITLGVAALVTVLSVFNGFSSLVSTYLISLDPYIRVEAISQKGVDEIRSAEKHLVAAGEGLVYTPYVESKVLLLTPRTTKVVTMKGIDSAKGDAVLKLSSFIKQGAYSLGSLGDAEKIILGSALADYLGAVPGDTLTVVTPVTVENAVLMGSMPATRKVIVSGLFHSQHNEYDAMYMFMEINTACQMLGYGNTFQGYELRFAALDDAEEIKARVSAALPPADIRVQTWFDLHQELLLVMQIERWAAFLLLMLIIIVAVFNILASLAMSVMEKKRDIGIMQTMGLQPDSVKKIFLILGSFTGALGTFLGFSLALFVYWLQKTYNIYPLDPQTFKIDTLPMELRFMDFVFVGATSLGLSILAAIIPARRAAKVDALDAIRWE